MEKHLRRLDAAGRALSDDNADGIASRYLAAYCLEKIGKRGEALALAAELLPLAERYLGKHHPQTEQLAEKIEEWRR